MNRAENIFNFRRINMHGTKSGPNADPDYADKYHPGGGSSRKSLSIDERLRGFMDEYEEMTVHLEVMSGRDPIFDDQITRRMMSGTGMIVNMHPYKWHEGQVPTINGKPVDTIWTAELEERFSELYEGLDPDQQNTLTVVLAQIGQGVRKADFYNMWAYNFTEAERQMFNWKVDPSLVWDASGNEIKGILVEEIWKGGTDALHGGPHRALNAMRSGLDLADKWNVPILTGANAFDPNPLDSATVGAGLPTTRELTDMYLALGFEYVDADWTYGEDLVYWPGSGGPLR